MIQRILKYNNFGKSLWALVLCITLLITGCSLPQVSAESRLFLNLSLDFIDDYSLPQNEFQGTTVGGFSALTYDRQRNHLYALTNDPAQPRFYTFTLNTSGDPAAALVSLENVTFLADHQTSEINSGHLMPEGIALTPHNTIFIASAGDTTEKSPPRLVEFQRNSGQWQLDLPLPKHYGTTPTDSAMPLGIASTNGLGPLTILSEGDRLFAATQGPLIQDEPQSTAPEAPRYSRFLHYWIGEPEPILIAEHLYPLSTEDGTTSHLSDMIPVDNAGHFLTLERHYSPTTGYSAAIYQIATGVATDTSRIQALSDTPKRPAPILKKPLLNLADLNLPLQNLKGIVLGPYFNDGTRSVVLVSNNNLDANTATQWLLLRLSQHPQGVSD